MSQNYTLAVASVNDEFIRNEYGIHNIDYGKHITFNLVHFAKNS